METVSQSSITSDEQVRRLVSQRLTQDAEVDSLAVSLTVEDGVVTLDGVLGSHAERLLVIDRVTATPGVRRVINGLTVRPCSTDWRLSDEQIAFDVSKAISDLSGGRAERISVDVQRRIVTLSGDVANAGRRALIRHAAEGVCGVAFIDNFISIAMKEPAMEEVRS